MDSKLINFVGGSLCDSTQLVTDNAEYITAFRYIKDVYSVLDY